MARKSVTHRRLTALRTFGGMPVVALLSVALISDLPAVQAGQVSYEVLHEFVPFPGGASPNVLIEGRDKVLYGTTSSGGAHNRGTIFRLDDAGLLTILYSFDVPPTDGSDEDPPTALVQGSDGILYGTTGNGSNDAAYPGTVFRLDPDGVFTTLHSFSFGGAGGSNPTTLIEGSDGNLYGTTHSRTIFRLDRNGSLTTLHSFERRLLGAAHHPHRGERPESVWDHVREQRCEHRGDDLPA